MKILHINSNYLYTTLFEKMIESFSNEEHTVFSPISGEIKFTIQPKSYVYNPILFKSSDKFLFKNKQKKIIQGLEQTLNVKEYDLIHAHTLFTDGNVAYEIYKKFGIPYIVAIRNTDLNMFFKYRLNLRSLGLEILKNAQKVIFLSQTYLDEILQKYIKFKYHQMILNKSVILPNGIDDFWFKNKLDERNLIQCNNEETLKIVYAGKINKNKNLETSLKAISLLREKDRNVEFYIAGEIQDNRIAEKVFNHSFVHYMGVLDKSALIKLYRETDIFLMPSYNETFGLVYAEAMTQGLPVLYTKGQGFDEQFRNGEIGFSVDARNAADIESKIITIETNLPTLKKNCLNVVDKFKWSNISIAYKELYKECCNNE